MKVRYYVRKDDNRLKSSIGMKFLLPGTCEKDSADAPNYPVLLDSLCHEINDKELTWIEVTNIVEENMKGRE